MYNVILEANLIGDVVLNVFLLTTPNKFRNISEDRKVIICLARL